MGRNVGIPPLASSFHLIHCTAHRPSPLPPARLSVHPLLPRRRMPPPPTVPFFLTSTSLAAAKQSAAAMRRATAGPRRLPRLGVVRGAHEAQPAPLAPPVRPHAPAGRRPGPRGVRARPRVLRAPEGPRRGRAAPRTRREADRVTLVSVISAIAHLGAPALRRVSGLMLMLSRKGLRSRRS
jgi:hypothetical protein